MDKRIEQSQKRIKETFISLLEKKDISKITVSEICKDAKVNRATFYKYYEDQYDLLNKIQTEYINQLKNIPPAAGKKIHLFVTEILDIIYKNRREVEMFSKVSGIYFLNPFVETCYNICYDLWKTRNPKLSDDEISRAVVFLFNGSLGVIAWWMARDFKDDKDEIAQIIENLSYRGIKNTLKL